MTNKERLAKRQHNKSLINYYRREIKIAQKRKREQYNDAPDYVIQAVITGHNTEILRLHKKNVEDE